MTDPNRTVGNVVFVTPSGAVAYGAVNLAGGAGYVSGILPVLNGGTGLASPGTSGNVLTSNGTAWVSSPASGGGVSVANAAGTGATVWRDTVGGVATLKRIKAGTGGVGVVNNGDDITINFSGGTTPAGTDYDPQINVSGAFAAPGNIKMGSSYISVGASPAAAGLLRVPSATSNILMAGAKVLLGSTADTGFLFTDAGLSNQATVGKIYAASEVLLGVGTTSYLDLYGGLTHFVVDTQYGTGALPASVGKQRFVNNPGVIAAMRNAGNNADHVLLSADATGVTLGAATGNASQVTNATVSATANISSVIAGFLYQIMGSGLIRSQFPRLGFLSTVGASEGVTSITAVANGTQGLTSEQMSRLGVIINCSNANGCRLNLPTPVSDDHSYMRFIISTGQAGYELQVGIAGVTPVVNMGASASFAIVFVTPAQCFGASFPMGGLG